MTSPLPAAATHLLVRLTDHSVRYYDYLIPLADAHLAASARPGERVEVAALRLATVAHMGDTDPVPYVTIPVPEEVFTRTSHDFTYPATSDGTPL